MKFECSYCPISFYSLFVFYSACPTRFYKFCTWGPNLCEVPSIYAAGIYAWCLAKKYPAYMPGTSQRGGPHHLFGRYPAYMLGSSRLSQSTPITHADWLPIRNEEMLKKVKDKLINRACLLQRGWTHGAGHLTDICIYRLKRDGYRNGIHDRYLFLNLYNFLQKNKSHVADDLSASE